MVPNGPLCDNLYKPTNKKAPPVQYPTEVMSSPSFVVFGLVRETGVSSWGTRRSLLEGWSYAPQMEGQLASVTACGEGFRLDGMAFRCGGLRGSVTVRTAASRTLRMKERLDAARCCRSEPRARHGVTAVGSLLLRLVSSV